MEEDLVARHQHEIAPLLRRRELFAGVDNVFDRACADHLNRGNLFDPEPVRINEPGRTFWIRLGWRGGVN